VTGPLGEGCVAVLLMACHKVVLVPGAAGGNGSMPDACHRRAGQMDPAAQVRGCSHWQPGIHHWLPHQHLGRAPSTAVCRLSSVLRNVHLLSLMSSPALALIAATRVTLSADTLVPCRVDTVSMVPLAACDVEASAVQVVM
jgi:hypothetical protein